MTQQPVAAVVLAAGKGKRMRSRTSKVLHSVGGRPMIDHVLGSLAEAGVGKIIVVTGYDEGQVKGHLGERAECVTQAQQLGTGHAVMQAEPALKNFHGMVMITCGDTPLWRADTLRHALNRAQEPDISGVVLTMRLDHPAGYGRIVRGPRGEVTKIVEQKDATEDEALICEVNSGTYCFHSRPLFDALKLVTNANAQGEYYLTDVIEIMIRK
ncbi:NTP transferase domain-containing protein, partial [Candidatus Sumerlaeota bacterium]|nr:NTP transferase domain-containing protein [Candidatus Sumerlaeota bacterium]